MGKIIPKQNEGTVQVELVMEDLVKMSAYQISDHKLQACGTLLSILLQSGLGLVYEKLESARGVKFHYMKAEVQGNRLILTFSTTPHPVQQMNG